jgi:hypothetical protein
MNIPVLSQETVDFLAPYIPFLVESGGEAGENAQKILGLEDGEVSLEKARFLWELLWPKIEAEASLHKVVQEAAQNPYDSIVLSVLRFQIKKLLAKDALFAAEIARLVGGPNKL